ncbi:hypothetical protein [Microbulbifer sp. GL-2]|uniref:hypothetical protein n=1 Tax=Microbulbifer sp. GL-2 TaxID=2591606 RepID=UPI0011805A92|nr:hypothetical protein [Microbulbifer sp. GL-2]
MDIIEPESIEVLSLSPYEHIHYKDSEGRDFLVLHQEVGFFGYSEVIILTNEESRKLDQEKSKFIKRLLATFDLKTKTFGFHKNQRCVPDFKSWPCVKVALDKWHGRASI